MVSPAPTAGPSCSGWIPKLCAPTKPHIAPTSGRPSLVAGTKCAASGPTWSSGRKEDVDSASVFEFEREVIAFHDVGVDDYPPDVFEREEVRSALIGKTPTGAGNDARWLAQRSHNPIVDSKLDVVPHERHRVEVVANEPVKRFPGINADTASSALVPPPTQRAWDVTRNPHPATDSPLATSAGPSRSRPSRSANARRRNNAVPWATCSVRPDHPNP